MSRGAAEIWPDVAKAAETGLCVGCLACGAVCPSRAITFEHAHGVRQPAISTSVCTKCGRCVSVCPAAHLPGSDEAECPGVEWIEGRTLQRFVGFARDEEIRARAVSGGVASALLLTLLEESLVDEVYALQFEGRPGTDADLSRLEGRSAVLSASGSKYLPPGAADVFRALDSDPSRTLGVVATPCVLQSILAFMRSRRIPRERLLAIGLVCDRTMSPRALDHMAWKQGLSETDVTGVAYRTKRSGGWPGGVGITLSDASTVLLDRSARTRLKPWYQLRRCVLCGDKLNRDADIVLGDCYIPGLSDEKGASTVLVRTEAGARALAAAMPRSELTEVSAHAVRSSQGLETKRQSLVNAAAMAPVLGLATKWDVGDEASASARKEVARAWKRISLAETHGHSRVERAIVRDAALSRARRALARLEMATAIIFTYIRSLAYSKPSRRDGDVKAVVVVGAGFSNRGAQALLFAVMDGVRERFLDAEVYVATPLPLPGAEERYRVRVLPWTFGIKAKLAGWHMSRIGSERFPDADKAAEVKSRLSECACMIDASGFRLASEFGVIESLDYCTNLLLARMFDLPVYVMPQSFGPFAYPRPARPVLRVLMDRGLGGARRVWARESDGLNLLSGRGLSDLRLAPDIVLAHTSRDERAIYLPGCGPNPPAIEGSFACVVPSLRVGERRAQSDLVDLYARISRVIAREGRKVVLLAHSAEDLQLCRSVMVRAELGDAAIILGDGLDAVELETLIGQGDFIVASRYHSIVHAYRRGVPAVILGWAVKYRELAALVGQERFVFEVDADGEDILTAVAEMTREWRTQSALIGSQVGAGFPDAIAETVQDL